MSTEYGNLGLYDTLLRLIRKRMYAKYITLGLGTEWVLCMYNTLGLWDRMSA